MICQIYPNIESYGLPLFEAQVEFRSGVWSLRLFDDFIVLFHPPGKDEGGVGTEVQKILIGF